MNSHPFSKKAPALSPPTVVTTALQLATLVEALRDEPAVGVDTESNSLYAYQEQVCLIQFSIPGGDYVVDSLAGLDLSSLGPIFANGEVRKVFHAAEYDVMCLKRDFDFRFVNLFDTMWTARILGWSRVGLGDVLKETFEVHTRKRYQRYNWGKRPLEPDALIYACMDTHYLLPLQRLQADALTQQARWEEAQEAFKQVAASEPFDHTFNPEGFWRVKGVRDLAGREQAVLRELWIWRDKEACRWDRPHFKVLNDHILVRLAQVRPRTWEELVDVNSLKPHHLRRYGRSILRATERGNRAPVPRRPSRPPRRSEAQVARYQALRAWRKQVAAERGVESDVIVGNAVLWALAERCPHTLDGLEGIEGLGPWKRKSYGEAILRVLADS